MRLFVTGTDTDVGKTAITACLARAARDRGTVCACKPVASGVPAGEHAEDAVHIGTAAGHPPLCFARFIAPLSPHRAAAMEGRVVPADIPSRIASLSADTVLVEGVGGWCVPLSSSPALWVTDLACATGGDVLIVAADRLGVLSHTLLTVRAIVADGHRPVGVVLNQLPGTTGASATTNLADLRSLLSLPVVPVPAFDPGSAQDQTRIGALVWRDIVPSFHPIPPSR